MKLKKCIDLNVCGQNKMQINLKKKQIFTNLKNINLHLSQKRLKIERNGQNLGITYTVYVHSKTIFQHFKNLKKNNLMIQI